MDRPESPDPLLALGIDTCGPAGSVALARLTGNDVDVLGEAPLEGRTYSATLVSAIARLLDDRSLTLRALACIVVVNGPGSFTGVRVGLSAAKGLAEGAAIPLVAVSRLAVLAQETGVPHSALDAHRHEVFLRIEGRELLAGAAELASISPPARIAVCDDGAAALLAAAWPATALVRLDPPTAAGAVRLAAPLIRAAKFDDVALLDGHYLRRSDAEIFGDPSATPARN